MFFIKCFPKKKKKTEPKTKKHNCPFNEYFQFILTDNIFSDSSDAFTCSRKININKKVFVVFNAVKCLISSVVFFNLLGKSSLYLFEKEL